MVLQYMLLMNIGSSVLSGMQCGVGVCVFNFLSFCVAP